MGASSGAGDDGQQLDGAPQNAKRLQAGIKPMVVSLPSVCQAMPQGWFLHFPGAVGSAWAGGLIIR
ncbi:hypothetical protein [uncultured Thiodictyon sp.]|jgi:hypothetical protein|uniref:hypothetical protein n=1 Tax=uncultured Thiodictyon sp. TaxID=1846217 RepID=UPI0025EE43B8|nr:hypothetical protein [uncultured Thiodictyon sp.]